MRGWEESRERTYMAEERSGMCFRRADPGERSAEGEWKDILSSAPAPSPGEGRLKRGASRVLQHGPLKLAWVKQSHILRDTGGLQPCLFSLPKALPVNTIQVA